MDMELYAEERGTGAPLLLLHGNGEDHTYFSHQIAAFSPYFHVIAVDTRGHGRSPRGSAPFTISQFADDLRAFLDARGIARADILGFSDGGNIALTFALRYPAHVGRLVLNGANLDPAGVKARVQLPIVLGYRIARLFAGASPEAKRHAELLGLMVNEPHIRPEALHALTAPTLVIAGTRDMIRTAHTKQIAAHIPDAALVLLPGDHFLAAKAPEAFNRAVLRFLRPELM